MKKIFGILAAAGILLVMFPVSVMADPVEVTGENAVDAKNYQWMYRNRQQKCYNEMRPISDDPEKQVCLRGIWGYSGDNESDGYFGGRITRRNRVGVFKGLYNISGDENKSGLIGVMRFCYFNGRIITSNGSKCPVVGLYKFDKEEQLFKLRWMTPHRDGWAVARIVIPEQ